MVRSATISHTTKDGLFTFAANMTPRVIDRNKSASVYGSVIKNNPTMPVYDPESANGYYRFPSGGDSSNIVEQLNEEENGTEIKLLEWNATAAVNLLPLFNPKNPNMVLKSQVTVSQYQVDKFNGWFIRLLMVPMSIRALPEKRAVTLIKTLTTISNG